VEPQCSAKHVVALRKFQGFCEGSPFFLGIGRNGSFLQYIDASDHRAAFRFQVGQLVVQEVECS